MREQEQNELHQYPLFVALTRAPMIMGVTLTFFVLSLVPCMILFLITKNIIVAGGIFLLLYVVGVVFCHHDEHFFEILLGKLELSCPNRKLWGCNSYDPS